MGVGRRLEFGEAVKLSNGAEVLGCEVRHGINPALVARVRSSSPEGILVQDLDLQTIQERGVSEFDAIQMSPETSQAEDSVSLYVCIRNGKEPISDWKMLTR